MRPQNVKPNKSEYRADFDQAPACLEDEEDRDDDIGRMALEPNDFSDDDGEAQSELIDLS